MKLQKPTSPAGLLLVLLLATDALLIIAHVLWLTLPYFENYNYSLIQEGGFGETLQYFKAFWLLLIFVWIAIIARQASYLSWAAVFGYLGLDDLMEIHEEVGNDIARNYDLSGMLGQRPRDIGEMVIFAIAGAVLLLVLAVAWYRGNETFRQRSKTLLKLSALLIFFGIVVDAIHIILLDSVLERTFAVIEDGGEMLALSVVCWFAFYCLWSDIEPSTVPETIPSAHRSTRQRSRRHASGT